MEKNLLMPSMQSAYRVGCSYLLYLFINIYVYYQCICSVIYVLNKLISSEPLSWLFALSLIIEINDGHPISLT